MRKFQLWRLSDASGVSGTGIVAEGIQFTDGTAAMRWKTSVATTAVAPSVDYFNYIHGHGGATRVVWVDNECFTVGDEVINNDPESSAYGRTGTLVLVQSGPGGTTAVDYGSPSPLSPFIKGLYLKIEPVQVLPPAP